MTPEKTCSVVEPVKTSEPELLMKLPLLVKSPSIVNVVGAVRLLPLWITILLVEALPPKSTPPLPAAVMVKNSLPTVILPLTVWALVLEKIKLPRSEAKVPLFSKSPVVKSRFCGALKTVFVSTKSLALTVVVLISLSKSMSVSWSKSYISTKLKSTTPELVECSRRSVSWYKSIPEMVLVPLWLLIPYVIVVASTTSPSTKSVIGIFSPKPA